MGNLDYKQFTERYRRIHPPGRTLFVTYRLADSIPKATILAYKAKKEWLENELGRVKKMAQDSETLQLRQLLEQVDKFSLECPVKAGLVKDWRDWRWSYCRSELVDE